MAASHGIGDIYNNVSIDFLNCFFRKGMSYLKIEVDLIMSTVLHQLQIIRTAYIWNCMHVPLKKMLKFLELIFYRIVSAFEWRKENAKNLFEII